MTDKMQRLWESMKAEDDARMAAVNHPEFQRLMTEAKRMDCLALPQEGRAAKVSKEFYDLRHGEKTLGFELEVVA